MHICICRNFFKITSDLETVKGVNSWARVIAILILILVKRTIGEVGDVGCGLGAKATLKEFLLGLLGQRPVGLV